MAVSQIEIEPVGQSFALHAPASGAIVLTNPFGARLARRIASGMSPADAAEELAGDLGLPAAEVGAIVDSILAVWDGAGLMAGAAEPFVDPVAHRPAEPAAEVAYARDGRTVVVRYEDRLHLEQIDAVLSFLVEPANPDAVEGAEVIEVIRADDGRFGVFSDGAALWGAAVFDEVRHFVIRDVLECLTGRDAVGATLHAGAVELDGGVAIISGESGSGKTTLTLGLIDAGCTFVADDHLMLSVDGASVHAAPVRASAKTNSWDLHEIAARLVGNAADAPREGVRYAEPAPAAPAWAALPAGLMIFPTYAAEGPDQCRQLTPEEAFLALIAAGARTATVTRTVAPLAALACNVPAFAVSFGGSEYSVPTCMDLIRAETG